VSLTPVANEKNLQSLFATGVADTGGKFAAGVVDTGGNLPPVSLTPAANLPPVSTTLLKLVANLPQRHRWSTFSCEYLREFSKKFETALMVYSGAWGKLIHEKNQKQKIS
jgi:hypothetical protein